MLYVLTLTGEEIIYSTLAILLIVTIGCGFTRFFALSFANPPPEEGVDFDYNAFNPLTNLDIIGIIVFFAGGFGWGKQIDDQEIRFKKQKLGWFILSLIAPFTSMVLALTVAFVKHTFWTDLVVQTVIDVSVTVTAYHLLPIPPLASSRLIYLLVPRTCERVWSLFCKVGPFIILAMVLFDRFSEIPFLRYTFAPVVEALGRFVAYH
jgi:cell division protein FtsW (lipid II flippase)